MTAPTPNRGKKRIAIDTGIGAAMGGSKAFGARAGAGEALDWSKHFAGKYPKIKPVTNVADKAFGAIHAVPRGPLLAGGVAAGAIAGAAYGRHKNKELVGKKLYSHRDDHKRVTWTEGRYHRNELGQFAGIGSAISVGVSGVYGHKASKARKDAKKFDRRATRNMHSIGEHLNSQSLRDEPNPANDLEETLIRHTGRDYVDNATTHAFQDVRAAQRLRFIAGRNAKVAGTAAAISLALGAAHEGLKHDVAKAAPVEAVKQKTSRAKRALRHLTITPEQARHASVLGQVGTAAGSVVGTTIGAGIGLKTGHPATGAGVGAGLGAALGGGAGASLGIYSGHRARVKKAKDGHSSQWEKNTANGLNAVGGAADAVALKTGWQATRRSFKTKLPADASRAAKLDHLGNRVAFPLAVGGLAAAGINAHLINAKPKKGRTVSKSENIEEVFAKSRVWPTGEYKKVTELSGSEKTATKASLQYGKGVGGVRRFPKQALAAAKVVKNMDVEEIFKFSREAKKGAKIGAAIEGVAGGLSSRSVGGAVGGALMGTVEGAAVGGLVHGHRRRVAARTQRNAALAAPVAKAAEVDVEEIFKLSRDAKVGAAAGAGYTGYKMARSAKTIGAAMKQMPGSPKAKIAAVALGGAVSTGINAGIGAGAGGIVHGFRKPKTPGVPQA